MQSFPEKIAAIEQELCDLDLEDQTPNVCARKASLLRSLDWYRARSSPRVITSLGAGVADEINAREST